MRIIKEEKLMNNKELNNRNYKKDNKKNYQISKELRNNNNY